MIKHCECCYLSTTTQSASLFSLAERTETPHKPSSSLHCSPTNTKWKTSTPLWLPLLSLTINPVSPTYQSKEERWVRIKWNSTTKNVSLHSSRQIIVKPHKYLHKGQQKQTNRKGRGRPGSFIDKVGLICWFQKTHFTLSPKMHTYSSSGQLIGWAIL